MPDVAGGAAVFSAEVIRVRGKTAGAVSVALRKSEHVVRVHRGVPMQTTAEVDDELVLAVTTARVVLEHVASRRRIDVGRNEVSAIQRANAAGWNIRDKRARQRRIQRHRAQHVQRADVDVARGDSEIVWQLSLDTHHRLHRVRRLDSVLESIDSSRNGKRQQLVHRGNVREEVRIEHRELLLVDSVQTQRRHRQVFTDAIVEDAVTTAHDRLRLWTTGLPGETNARCEVEIAVNVALVFVTQAKTQRQIRTNFPIVLEVAAEVPLADLAL